VCVHIRNILRARGCYRHVKVPSSPYKRGRKGTCKRIQTFLELVLLVERFSVSLRPNLVLERAVNYTRVREVIRIFRVSPPNSELHLFIVIDIVWRLYITQLRDMHVFVIIDKDFFP
jgi:hypothetical protein